MTLNDKIPETTCDDVVEPEPRVAPPALSAVAWWLPEITAAGLLVLVGLLLWWPALALAGAVVPYIAIRVAVRSETNNHLARVAADQAAAAAARCPCDRLVADCVRLDRNPESVTTEVCVFRAEQAEEVGS